MSKENQNDMERIQKNLEQFLQQEISQPQRNVDRNKNVDADDEAAEYDNDEDDDDDIDYDDEEDEDEDDEEEGSGFGFLLFPGTGRRAGRKKKKKPSHRKSSKTKKGKKNIMAGSNKKNKRDSGKKAGKRDKRGKQGEEREKKSGFKKVLLVLLFLFLILGAIWYFAVGAAYGKMIHTKDSALAGEVLKDQGVTNILLIGSDSHSSEEEGRSDAMILLSVSTKTNSIHMTSLLRDMYVEIPGHDGNRLNAAYSFGGPELLLETVKQNLGIEVNRYVVVNFEAFANLVDAVGGVDLELTNEEVQWVNAYLNEYNMLRNMPMETDYLDTALSGVIHLNGPQSLAYSRNRYIGTDFGRTERQRKVLSEVFKKLPAAVVKNPDGLINGIFPNLTTNLSKLECMRLSLDASKLATYEMIQTSIPLEGTYQNADIRGMAVLQVDFEANKAYIKKEIYGK